MSSNSSSHQSIATIQKSIRMTISIFTFQFNIENETKQTEKEKKNHLNIELVIFVIKKTLISFSTMHFIG